MKTFCASFCAVFLVVGIACNSSKPASATTSQSNHNTSRKEENQNPPVDLADYLSRISSVSVRGSGSTARVSIRGMSALNSDIEPLFVINGVPVNGGLSSASANVRVSDIKSVRILKTASETAFYGDQGSSGVILISLKY